MNARSPSPSPRHAALALGACLLLAACSSPVDERLRADFHAALGHTTITVYPAAVLSNTEAGNWHDAASADRLAAWLGAQGLATATVSSEEVGLPLPGQGFQYDVFKAGAAAFGEHVRAHGLAGDYALLAEYLVTRVPEGGSRAGGVHAFVVDAQGRLVDALLLNSHHELFRKAAAATPADCTELVIAALAEDWQPAP